MSHSRILTLCAAGALSALLAACASTPSTPAMVSNGMLVGPNNMTLYTFDNDMADSGKSVCNGRCAENWPPLMAGADAKPMGGYSVVVRDDGKRQWAYKGSPLYYWVKDTKAGETTGDKVNGVWHTARP